MKGKRHTTEQKIRILREADGGKSIVEVSKEHNISEVTFHRWKRQFGQLDVNEAKRMKELERENAELKKMLADSLLKNRVLEAVNAKNGKPGTQAPDGRLRGGRPPVFRADGVPVPETGTVELPVSDATGDAVRRILDENNTSITLLTMIKTTRALGLQLDLSTKPMSPAALGRLGEKLVQAPDAATAKTVTEALVAGFYGRPQHATPATR